MTISKRIQGLLVNTLVAVAVAALLHVFFVAVPSHLAARGGAAGPAVASPAVTAEATEPTASVAAEPASAPPIGGSATPVHGPSGFAPGILAAPDRK